MRFTAVFSASLALAAGANAMSAADMVNNINDITDKSSDTNDIAKSISAVNMFQTAPQVVNNFKEIIETVTKDITAMNAKRDLSDAEKAILSKRQECLDVTDVQKCLQDVGEIAGNPGQALGRKRRAIHSKRQECLDVADVEKCLEDLGEVIEDPSEILGSRKRQANPEYSEMEQNQVCNAFRGFVQVHQALLKTVIGKHGLLSLTPFTQPIAAVLRTLEGGVDTIAFGIIDTVPTCAEGATNDKNSLDMTLKDAQDKYN